MECYDDRAKFDAFTGAPLSRVGFCVHMRLRISFSWTYLFLCRVCIAGGCLGRLGGGGFAARHSRWQHEGFS